MKPLPLVAWDVDDVLNDLTRCWIREKWLPEHSSCCLRYEDLRQNPPHDIIGVSRTEYLSSLDEYRATSYRDLVPDTEALLWFRTYGNFFRHIVITSVPLQAAHLSAEWVYRHFGQWIRGFFIAPSLRTEQPVQGYPLKKQDIFKTWIQPDIFIDDSPENVGQAQACKIVSLLRRRPWAGQGLEWGEITQSLEKFLTQGSGS